MPAINKKKLRERLEKCFVHWQQQGFNALQQDECELGWVLVPRTFLLDITSIVLSAIKEVKTNETKKK